MTLRLVIEHSTLPQPVTEMRHPGGDLSIGRGPDCNWQIGDPDMFVSRRHCVISERDGRYEVTDASRGGLFIDGANVPLGAGNTVLLVHDMRLRLGDVVIRVEIDGAAATGHIAARPAASSGLQGDDFFARRDEPTPPARRPDDLPEPFDSGRASASAPAARALRPEPPAFFDDPFTLDPVRPAVPAVAGAGSVAAAVGMDFDFSASIDDPRVRNGPPPEPARPAAVEPAPERARERGAPSPLRAIPAEPSDAPVSDSVLRAAYFRGLGLEPDPLDSPASATEMEALGRRFRLLVDGLMQLLRTRAKEKSSVRVAQTVIGSADVNPLKFLVTTEDVLAALVAPKGRGYLAPDDAISAAIHDLTDHQLRTWTAVQSALRRMIDRFDPAAFEAEIAAGGGMKSLLAGGRGARLWQLYLERYEEIARAAEDRFLGEIGADFRDAYEGNRRTRDDKAT